MIVLELPPFWHATAMQAGLAFIAGFLEACGLIALFGLFIGHITANIAVLGMAIATGVPGSWTKLLALPVFMAVVALTRAGVHPLRLHGYDTARLIMVLELVLLLAFVAAGLRFGPFTDSLGWSTMLTAALGVATLAVQNSGMRLVWRTRPSTTVMTLNLTQLALDSVVILREPNEAAAAAARERLVLVAPTLGGYLVGAAAGGLGYLVAGFYGGFVPASVLLMLIFVREEPS
ncbi:MAG TPA: YoaK family protein [Acetobacteraceae bacterium]